MTTYGFSSVWRFSVHQWGSGGPGPSYVPVRLLHPFSPLSAGPTMDGGGKGGPTRRSFPDPPGATLRFRDYVIEQIRLFSRKHFLTRPQFVFEKNLFLGISMMCYES